MSLTWHNEIRGETLVVSMQYFKKAHKDLVSTMVQLDLTLMLACTVSAFNITLSASAQLGTRFFIFYLQTKNPGV